MRAMVIPKTKSGLFHTLQTAFRDPATLYTREALHLPALRRINIHHKKGKFIAFLGKQLQKGHTYPTIIHTNIITNCKFTVNRINKLKI